jgi:hypothetical protein
MFRVLFTHLQERLLQIDILNKFQLNLNFLDRFSRRTQNFMKIRPVEAEVFHADGQTVRYEEANSRFPQLCEGARKLLESEYYTEVYPQINRMVQKFTGEAYDI